MKLEWNSSARASRKRRRLSATPIEGFVDPDGAEQSIPKGQGTNRSGDAPVPADEGVIPSATTKDDSEARDGGTSEPQSPAAQVARLQDEGNALAEEGNYGGALSRWEAALALDPCRAVLQEQRAQLLIELGDFWPAVKAATRATELEPGWAAAWVTLARAQLNFGEPAMAVGSLQRAVRLRPGDLEVLQELQDAQSLVVHRRLSERDAAISRFLPGLSSLESPMPRGLGGTLIGTDPHRPDQRSVSDSGVCPHDDPRATASQAEGDH